jgi:mono/diheme cytochrome c family protein
VNALSEFIGVPRLGLSAALLMVSAVALAATPSPSGHDVFMQSGCFACHGEAGYGGAGPRFRNDKLLAADQYVIGQILIGRGIMPAFAHRLNDEQIAAVATYVRNSWGNDFGPISVEDVAKARKQFTQGNANQNSSNSGESK